MFDTTIYVSIATFWWFYLITPHDTSYSIKICYIAVSSAMVRYRILSVVLYCLRQFSMLMDSLLIVFCHTLLHYAMICYVVLYDIVLYSAMLC